MANLEFCPITASVAGSYLSVITAISRKFASLQRLAQLLLQAGNSIALPNLSGLLPVGSIDFNAYASLVQACPFLNLPQVPTEANVQALQQLVTAAYQQLISSLANHPFNRLGQLQNQLDKVVSEQAGITASGPAFLQCLLQACGTAPTGSSATMDNFKSGYAANNGKVLTSSTQASFNNVTALIDATVSLINGPFAPPNLPPQQFQVPIPTDHPIPPPPITGVI